MWTGRGIDPCAHRNGLTETGTREEGEITARLHKLVVIVVVSSVKWGAMARRGSAWFGYHTIVEYLCVNKNNKNLGTTDSSTDRILSSRFFRKHSLRVLRFKRFCKNKERGDGSRTGESVGVTLELESMPCDAKGGVRCTKRTKDQRPKPERDPFHPWLMLYCASRSRTQRKQPNPTQRSGRRMPYIYFFCSTNSTHALHILTENPTKAHHLL